VEQNLRYVGQQITACNSRLALICRAEYEGGSELVKQLHQSKRVVDGMRNRLSEFEALFSAMEVRLKRVDEACTECPKHGKVIHIPEMVM
jgi:hypothetical protein